MTALKSIKLQGDTARYGERFEDRVRRMESQLESRKHQALKALVICEEALAGALFYAQPVKKVDAFADEMRELIATTNDCLNLINPIASEHQ